MIIRPGIPDGGPPVAPGISLTLAEATNPTVEATEESETNSAEVGI